MLGFFYYEGNEGERFTGGKGGGDFVDRVTGSCWTSAAVAVTETRQSQTLRFLPGLTAENARNNRKWAMYYQNKTGEYFCELKTEK